jgi:hypothetical protein
MNPPRTRMTIAQIMIGVALCALIIKWPILLIPATLGLVMSAVEYRRITTLDLLILVDTLLFCGWLWLTFFPGTLIHGRPVSKRLDVFACVIVEGGIVFWVLRRWRLRRLSVEAAKPSSTIDASKDPVS